MTKKKNPHIGVSFESWLDQADIRVVDPDRQPVPSISSNAYDLAKAD